MDFTGEMENEEIKKFNDWFSSNYSRIRQQLQTFCYYTTYNWSDDVFHDMYLNIINSITNGCILNYNKIDDYIFICYRNSLNNNNALAWNANRDTNINSDNITNKINTLEDDEEEKKEDEEQFQKIYKFLCVVEKDIYASCGEEIGAVFSKKFDNQLLDVKNGERKKFEDAKKYVRENWAEYYKNNIKIKKSKV